MGAIPLPYLPRPQDEESLCAFLLDGLQPGRGVPKALLLCGSTGVGKRTLVRHAFESDRRFKEYRVVEIAPEPSIEIIARVESRKGVGTAAEVVGEGLNYAFPLAGFAYTSLRILLHDQLFGQEAPHRTGGLPDYSILATSEPLLVIVSQFNSEDVDILRRCAGLIREVHHRDVPVALLLLDDSAAHKPKPPHCGDAVPGEACPGLRGLRRFLENDHQLKVLRLWPLSQVSCQQAIVRLGLSQEWAKLFFQFSEGSPAELNFLWLALQKRGIIERVGGGRWKAVDSAVGKPAWDIARDLLIHLLQPRTPGDTVHEARLITSCFMAAAMGSSFLPQAVAECVFAIDSKRNVREREAWEDLWYDVLEYHDPEHSALAAPQRIEGTPKILQADTRQFFVYTFRDPALVNLLRAALRSTFREPGNTSGPPHSLLTDGIRALEGWLDRSFDDSWREALEFRAALLRVRNRDWEASPLEDRRHCLYLQEQLCARVEKERQQVERGHSFRDLFVCLVWLGETLYELGEYRSAVDVLAEAKQLADEQGVSRDEALNVLNLLGSALLADGRSQQAESIFSVLWNLSSEVYGPGDPRTLTAGNNLAAALAHSGRYDEAEPLYRWVLEVSERVQGREHMDTASAVHNLAALLYQKRNYEEAEPLCRRALQAREQVLGPDNPETLESMKNLASLLASCSRYNEAEPLLRRSLETRERVLGRDHPDTLASVDSLAVLLDMRGDPGGAEPLLRRALEARQQVLGPEHPDTLASVHSLAALLGHRGDHGEAEPLYRRAVEVRDRVLGPAHPDTLLSISNLALMLHQRGRFGEAEPLCRRALDGRSRALGPDHPDTLASLHNLAGVLDGLGAHHESEPLHRRALEARERVLGWDHQDTLASANNLAVLLYLQARDDEAEPLYRRVLDAHERALGWHHPDTLASASNLAALLSTQGRAAEAEPLYRRILQAHEDVLGPDDPHTLDSVDDLGTLLFRGNRLREAEPLFRRLAEAHERELGPEHPDTLLSLNNLANLLKLLGHYDEAELLCRRALDMSRRVLGPEHPLTATLTDSLSGLLDPGKRK